LKMVDYLIQWEDIYMIFNKDIARKDVKSKKRFCKK
jgi:hypothetical protein